MRTKKISVYRYRLIGVLVLTGTMHGCFVKSVCYNSADCSTGQVCYIDQGSSKGVCREMCEVDTDCAEGYVCDQATHVCQEAECTVATDCGADFDCVKGQCVSVAPLICPDGMVPIERRFCIDKYEASRSDATAVSWGVDETKATSRFGVKPWKVSDNAEAADACRAAGKSLCTEEQWFMAGSGPEETVYSYGDEYDPAICNGIDTFCYCDSGDACGNQEPCPYPYCREDCGADVHLEPTGQFSGCTNDYGVFDMNGGVWEHVLGGDGKRIRGGAYNCMDSKTLHRCDYIPGDWSPTAQGFRCCADGVEGADAGVHSDAGEEPR